MTEESSGPTAEYDGDGLNRGRGRRRSYAVRGGPAEEYLRLEYPTESSAWPLRGARRVPSLRAQLTASWRRRRGRPPLPE